MSAISAIDIALWDIKGKALGVPIYQLLGGKCRDELRCYASQLQFGWTTKIGPWGSDKEYVDIVRHAVSEGYDAVKIDFTTYDENAKKIPHLSKEGFPDVRSISGSRAAWLPSARSSPMLTSSSRTTVRPT